MTEIVIHRARLEIQREMPTNSLSMNVRMSDGVYLQIYLQDLEQWWAVRNSLPKGEDYHLSTGGNFIHDHITADTWARDFYEREKAKLQAASEVATVEVSPEEEVAK